MLKHMCMCEITGNLTGIFVIKVSVVFLLLWSKVLTLKCHFALMHY